MKTLKLLACLLFFALLGSGCKRIVYCKNTCYICYYSADISKTNSLCNTTTPKWWYEQRLQDLTLLGYVCEEVEPSEFYKLSGNKNDIRETSSALEAGGYECYDKDDYDPDYFDYETFKTNTIKCQACYDTIAKHYLEAYFDTLDTYTNGFCAECIPPGFQTSALPGMIAYAASKVEYMHCGHPNAPKATIYVGLFFRSLQFDTTLTQQEHNNWVLLNNWVDFNPVVAQGFYAPVFRKCKN